MYDKKVTDNRFKDYLSSLEVEIDIFDNFNSQLLKMEQVYTMNRLEKDPLSLIMKIDNIP